MAANNLGTAYIKIAPQMEGIQSAISSQLQKAASSTKISTSSIAVGTVIAKGISTALNAISNSVDYAVSRVDTLAVFPKVMKNLGFEAEESESAVKKLSDRIEGLPTTLDEIVTYTQRLASSTGTLNKGMKNATSIAIAFNDAALAGGKGQEEANRAFEQFVQVISRGRPTMQDWKIMLEVMPGQLKQMAKYMGENNDSLKEYAKQAGKTADQLDGMDLYEWISADKNAYAKERLDQFTTALVELDEKGGNGITSFKDQVGDATKTIGNAMRLIPIRIGKAVASVIEAFGQKDIYSAIDKFTSSFSDMGKWLSKNVVPVIKDQIIPAFKNMLSVIGNVANFIKSNAYVSDILKNILTAILAFKGVEIVGTKLISVGQSALALFTNLSKGAEVFKQARAAGMTFSSSLGAVAGSTTGASSAIASMIQSIFSWKGAIAGLAVAGILGVQAAIIGCEIDTKRAATAARDYARAHYTVQQAAESAARAQNILKQTINDVKNAEMAANNAEIAALEYKKQAAEYQSEMNKLKAEGKQNTDEYRLAELKYNQAIAQQAEEEKKLKTAQNELAESKKQVDDLNSSGLYKANLVLASLMREGQEYGTLAAKLDELKTKTIQYKDENGNMVTATLEKSKEMAAGIAEQLANSQTKTGEVWRNIVDIANREGISYAEAAAKYGKQAGDNITGNFAEGVRLNTSLVTEATKEAGQKALNQMKESTKGSTDVGTQMMNGAGTGVEKAKLNFVQKAANAIREAIARMRKEADVHSPSKKTAEIGKFMSLGLAKGIDEYADEAVAAAEDATGRAISAFNGDVALGGTTSQIQPMGASTSGISGSGAVTQYNTFNQVDSNLDMQEISKRLGWQVATAI